MSLRSIVHTAVLTPTCEHPPHIKVLRAVASLELAKGLIVLAGIFGIFFLVHKDPGDVADWCLTVLHISPDHHLAQMFLDWADSLTDKKLWVVAAVAAIYCTLRFVEAYGLWKARPWAEWIALISGTLYLPYEIFKLFTRPNVFHIALLALNLLVVFYMAYLLLEARSSKTGAVYS
jgi:uncharacterized membrane protein (DUF2068 family)